jgi:hypothetical protein
VVCWRALDECWRRLADLGDGWREVSFSNADAAYTVDALVDHLLANPQDSSVDACLVLARTLAEAFKVVEDAERGA